MDEERLHATIAEIYDRCLAPDELPALGGIVERALGVGSSIHFVS